MLPSVTFTVWSFLSSSLSLSQVLSLSVSLSLCLCLSLSLSSSCFRSRLFLRVCLTVTLCGCRDVKLPKPTNFLHVQAIALHWFEWLSNCAIVLHYETTERLNDYSFHRKYQLDNEQYTFFSDPMQKLADLAYKYKWWVFVWLVGWLVGWLVVVLVGNQSS